MTEQPGRSTGGSSTGDRPVIYLHVGTPKSGTTYVQKLLDANRDGLAAAGVSFAGRRWKQQVRAVQDVLDLMRQDPRIDRTAEGAWDRLTAEMLQFRGRAAVVSMEFLSSANPKQAARIVGSFPQAEVRVILTVRTAVATIPGLWQSRIRNGATLSWEDYLHGLLDRGRTSPEAEVHPAVRMLRVSQGVPRMLGTWTSVVPAERVHVVTTPATATDPLLLWRRFAGVLEVDPGVATEPPARSNRALGLPSAELLRRVNHELGDVRRTRYQATMNQFLAQQVLSARVASERPVGLDRAGLEFAVRWNHRVRRAIEDAGVDVVGDLGDLADAVTDEELRAGDHVLLGASEDELLAAAEDARLGLSRRISELAEELRELGVEEAAGGHGAVPSGLDPGWDDRVGAAVAELAVLARRAMRLREQRRRARRAARTPTQGRRE